MELLYEHQATGVVGSAESVSLYKLGAVRYIGIFSAKGVASRNDSLPTRGFEIIIHSSDVMDL